MTIFTYDELSLINNILEEYYEHPDLDYTIIIDNYLEYYLINKTKKMNKKIIKYYYKSIRKAFKLNKETIQNIYPPIIISEELFRALTFIILNDKITIIIENEIDNDNNGDAETIYEY